MTSSDTTPAIVKHVETVSWQNATIDAVLSPIASPRVTANDYIIILTNNLPHLCVRTVTDPIRYFPPL
jgi:hypothetical protein